jgi:UDP-glucuronate 4-epimerase
VEGVQKTLLQSQPNQKNYSLYNIGNGSPVKLLDFIKAIETVNGKTAEKQMLPMQPGDVAQTWADTRDLKNDFNYEPNTDIVEGVQEFVVWYKSYMTK